MSVVDQNGRIQAQVPNLDRFFLVEIHDNLDFLNFVLLPVSKLFTRFICFSNDSCYNLTKASCLLKPIPPSQGYFL